MKIIKRNIFIHSVLLLFPVVLNVYSNETSNCGQKEIATSYLDVATDMISKAKFNMPSCNGGKCTQRPVDCADVFYMGHNRSGVYTIWPLSRVTENKALDVYCDMDTDGGGWTLIQRRGDFLRSNDYFYKDWKEYKEGFGNIQKDFWLGDSLMQDHNNQKFSTKDLDNDNNKDGDCAQEYRGAWWYGKCHKSNLNGLYLKGKHESFANGVNWQTWKGYHESLKSTEMKIRPKIFILPNPSQMTPLR